MEWGKTNAMLELGVVSMGSGCGEGDISTVKLGLLFSFYLFIFFSFLFLSFHIYSSNWNKIFGENFEFE